MNLLFFLTIFIRFFDVVTQNRRIPQRRFRRMHFTLFVCCIIIFAYVVILFTWKHRFYFVNICVRLSFALVCLISFSVVCPLTFVGTSSCQIRFIAQVSVLLFYLFIVLETIQ